MRFLSSVLLLVRLAIGRQDDKSRPPSPTHIHAQPTSASSPEFCQLKMEPPTRPVTNTTKQYLDILMKTWAWEAASTNYESLSPEPSGRAETCPDLSNQFVTSSRPLNKAMDGLID